MRSISRSLAVLLLVCLAAGAQQQVNLDTGIKGSRLPFFGTDSGTANTYVLTTIAPLGPVLRTGSMFVFFAGNASTGASTLAVDGGSAIAIKKNVSTALASGDIAASGLVIVVYDGTNFQLVGSGSGGGGGGTGGNNPYNVPVAASSTIPYAGMVQWLSADCVTLTDASTCSVPSNGTTISSWYDRSGNFYNMVASGTCTFNTAQINGQPAITMAGACGLDGYIPAIRGFFDVFVVFKNSGSSKGGIWGINNSNGFYYWSGGTGSKEQGVDNSQVTVVANGTAAKDSNWHQANVICGATTSPAYVPVFRLDRASDATIDTTTCNTAQTQVNVVAGNNQTGSEHLTGAIAEIIVYRRILSSTEITAVESYFNSKYGL